MNILYIIGNGFDLAQGMNTSYPDFYKYLESINGSPLLEQMKKDINDNKKYWSDMEAALGNFTVNVNTSNDLENLRNEIDNHLQTFLKSQIDAFSPNEEQKKSFMKDFYTIDQYIHGIDRSRYIEFVRTMFSPNENINVMSLNYTNTIEKLFEHRINIPDIIHAHGQLDGTIIFGVDNVEQIKKERFRSDDSVKSFFIKEDTNLAMMSSNFYNCEQLIKEANIIILFGASIGDTDLHWWKLIGNEMKGRENIGIIDYLHTDPISNSQQYKNRREVKKREKILLEKMGTNESEATDRLFIVINSKMFSGK